MNGNDSGAINKFAPPTATVADASAIAPATLVQASLARRAVAALIDLGPAYALSLYATFKGASANFEQDPQAALAYLKVIGLTWLVAVVMGIASMILFYRTGQSIGKRLLGLRVVRTDGSRMPFGRALGLRWIVSGLVVSIPAYAWMFTVHPTPVQTASITGLLVTWSGTVIDHLFALGRDRRALHDLIAGSRVATAASTPDATLAGAH